MSSGSAFAVTRMIGMNGRPGSALSSPADLDAVLARHHHVEQDQIGRLRARGDQRLVAVPGRDDLVALPREAGLQDLEVGRVVVDDQDPRRLAHGWPPSRRLGQELADRGEQLARAEGLGHVGVAARGHRLLRRRRSSA